MHNNLGTNKSQNITGTATVVIMVKIMVMAMVVTLDLTGVTVVGLNVTGGNGI